MNAELQINPRRILGALFGAGLFLLGGCGGEAPGMGGEDRALVRAHEIAARYPIIDTHIDLPYWMERRDWKPDVTRNLGTDGEMDYPRAVKGHLDGPFMSIYIPAVVDEAGEGWDLALKLISGIENLAKRHPDKFALASSPEDILANMEKGLVSLPMGMENGGPLRGDIDVRVAELRKRGVRYVGLTHSRNNAFSDSSYADGELWGGLSLPGRALVRKLNAAGIMVDVSHLSDEAFYDVLEETAAPVIASHSSARHFVPGFHRNLDDDAIRALAKNGGVIQINYGSSFVTAVARQWSDQFNADRKQFREETGAAPGSAEDRTFGEMYRRTSPFPYAGLEDVLDHIDHVVKLTGIDYVGIGSDYNGVGDSLPVGLKDVSTYPNLVAGLLKRGYSEEDIAKVLGGNLLRVWRQVEARRSQGDDEMTGEM